MSTNWKSTDCKALCAELVKQLEGWQCYASPDGPNAQVLARARTALAQPEPEGATERIASIATAVRECAFGWEPTARLIGNVCAEDVADLCGAILTHFAHPTIEPEVPPMPELRAASAEAQPAGLVERVANAICGEPDTWHPEARDAIREVAAAAKERIAPFNPWLRWNDVAQWLELEASQ